MCNQKDYLHQQEGTLWAHPFWQQFMERNVQVILTKRCLREIKYAMSNSARIAYPLTFQLPPDCSAICAVTKMYSDLDPRCILKPKPVFLDHLHIRYGHCIWTSRGLRWGLPLCARGCVVCRIWYFIDDPYLSRKSLWKPTSTPS